MKYYSDIKKNEILPFEKTWMDLEDFMLSEVSHTEKDKYCVFTYKQNVKKKTMNKYNKRNIFIDTENKLVVSMEIGVWEGQDRGKGLRGTKRQV